MLLHVCRLALAVLIEFVFQDWSPPLPTCQSSQRRASEADHHKGGRRKHRLGHRLIDFSGEQIVYYELKWISAAMRLLLAQLDPRIVHVCGLSQCRSLSCCAVCCCADGGCAPPCCGSGAEEHHLHTGTLRQLHRAAREAPPEHLQVRSSSAFTSLADLFTWVLWLEHLRGDVIHGQLWEKWLFSSVLTCCFSSFDEDVENQCTFNFCLCVWVCVGVQWITLCEGCDLDNPV